MPFQCRCKDGVFSFSLLFIMVAVELGAMNVFFQCRPLKGYLLEWDMLRTLLLRRCQPAWQPFHRAGLSRVPHTMPASLANKPSSCCTRTMAFSDCVHDERRQRRHIGILEVLRYTSPSTYQATNAHLLRPLQGVRPSSTLPLSHAFQLQGMLSVR